MVAGLLLAGCASASGSARHESRAAHQPTLDSVARAEVLWDLLATLTAPARDDIVVALTPDVRTVLRTIAESAAWAAVTH
ncbi:MAG TPA: hypothetical protein VEP49_21795 [Acidimicrobiia bacterium]|nr:hypothetical protein [Acidimicrobiia bacterium]